ncbi:MAG: DUF1501 domain-containing protein [Saprospiraceae bacterium]|nr:DUF1501 domain-containing protein [Saprospiraceae bacterium]MBK8449227.1 DUF1501 domain-containing protein [Saprospiraceae bacterium]MBK8484697.1 DUF1501 domain-containing protein [Saprospiraceae bacterium]MBK9222124.1 DUF1501 domain-containing protein [Saprospiraceae bacterium]MBK9720967.1 DUF1501 domain-containing protein [Saprospiraceae bacterium]
MTINKISRRKFVGQLSCAALGYTSIMNSLIHLKGINALTAANSMMDPQYKALVCLMLSGGNDSYNMLVPMGNKEYTDYAKIRSNLAIPKTELLPITVNNSPGRTFGIHPAMKHAQKLFEDGKLTFISNVGTLLEPTTKDELYNGTVKVPLGLLSHSDQYQQWQSSVSDKRSNLGWGGKMADLIRDMNQATEISMNISLAGTNLFQSGVETIEFVIDPRNGSLGISGYRPDNTYDNFNIARTHAIDTMLDHNYQDIFQKTYVDVIRSSRDGHLKFTDALDNAPIINTQFSDNDISQAFKMVARTISAHEDLKFKRQIFFINFSGWDHHDEVLNNQNEMLGIVDTAISEFNTALEELNLSNQVTTFSSSEFGRSLISNGNGTDHAWGGNVFVMGGAVNGKRLYGKYPLLTMNNDLNIYDGIMIPTTSVDQYFAEIALWMGVQPSDLSYMLPNIGNFYDTKSGKAPLGFLKF